MKLSAKAQTAMDKVVAKMQGGDLSPIIKVVAYERKGDPVPWDRWSLGNRVSTFVQSGGATDLRGIKQWRMAGRKLRKGCSASFLLIPRTVKKVNDDGEEEVRLVGFATCPVFAYGDTEGEMLPEHDYRPAEPPPLLELAERMGVEVDWDIAPINRGALGTSKADGSRVVLGTDDLGTWFHELAHAMLAKANGRLKGGQHEDQEVAAELAAAVLMELYGVDRTGNAWRYISHYSKDPLTAIAKAMREVETVLKTLGIN
jgi:hypothetical protein